jgi:hypothetical protein
MREVATMTGPEDGDQVDQDRRINLQGLVMHESEGGE